MKKTALVSMTMLFAGCVQALPSDGGTSNPWSLDRPSSAFPEKDWTLPFQANHSHNDPTLHPSSFGMREVFQHPLGGTIVTSSQAHALDLKGDWLFVATQGPQVGVNGGLWTFDVSDREKPVLTGRLPLFGNLGGDRSIEATQDTDFVVLGTEALACGVQLHPWAPGFYLIDVRDKANPRIVDYRYDAGVHSVNIHRIGDADYVFPASINKQVLKIERGGIRPTLVPISFIVIGHDGVIQDDPVLAKPLFYTALTNRLAVYDVSDPAKPTEIGSWTSEDPSDFRRHYSHMPEVFWLEGRRIIAFEMEDWKNEPSPIWMLDATDLSDIEKIGDWANPANMPANGYEEGMHNLTGFSGQLTFSTHNTEFEEGILYVAHYHAGLWMLDTSSLDDLATPANLGYFMPHNDNGGFRPRSMEGVYPKPDPYCTFSYDQMPNVFDLEVEGALVYLVDYHTGLYVVTREQP